MQIENIITKPYHDQKPGTSGLRKKTKVFMENPHYLQNFIQSIFNVLDVKGKRFVLGGDGRYFNADAIQIILKMAIANETKEIWVGQNGFLSTPALSVEIRKRKADFAIILTASHNPGGLDGDFGVKVNGANGAPAPETITNAIFNESKKIGCYQIAEMPSIDISEPATYTEDKTTIHVIDPVTNYANLTEKLFDFNAIATLFKKGFKFRYDAMNAVTGPYAIEIFEKRLGAPKGTVVNAVPKPDFGGLHPDPNLTYAKELVDVMYSPNAPDMGAASDGDGDRNMVLGNHFFANPSDAIAVLANNAKTAPGYQEKISGVARSMPTSRALDKVAEANGWSSYEVPTGWKFFGSLMDDNRIVFCGEESFGASSNHIREKDGLWAILFWLNIIAKTGMSPQQLTEKMWAENGRYYYSRYDYEGISADAANQMMTRLKQELPHLAGKSYAGLTIKKADEFDYTDPVTGERTENQGIRIFFETEERIIFRTSGTGTQGATLRIYFEKYEADPAKQNQDPQKVLAPLVKAAMELTDLPRLTGRDKPSVIT